MYKKLLWIATIALSLAFGQAAFANACEGLKDMVESLKLEDAQKAKIKPVLEQLRSQVKDSAAQMGPIRDQIKQQVTSDNMDQGTVDGLVDKKSKLIGDMMKAKITATHQIYLILNASQRTQMQEKVKQLEEKWADKFKSCRDE